MREKADDLVDKGEADELFRKQKRENLLGEKLTDKVIVEVGDSVEVDIAKFCKKQMLCHFFSQLSLF